MRSFVGCLTLFLVAMLPTVAWPQGPNLPRKELLKNIEDNRDTDWYIANIPFFECPDADIQTTYYYRWELLTKHLTYGSANSGYSFTEFIDRPFWSGTYGAISCPAGHQLYEARWLRDPIVARDYSRYWFRTPGAQPRNYSTWLADAIWAAHRVHPDDAFMKDLLPDLKKNHDAWEKRMYDPVMGLFSQNGHDDGMEFNINSRQTKDILRGAPGYRPTMNAYMWADALAIARVADLSGDVTTAGAYRAKASVIKQNLQNQLWDPKRQFFFHMFQRDEEADGFLVKARTLTHQTGRHAGSAFGRELIGYVPWQFGMPDAGKGYEAAWKTLIDPEGFQATFGPRTVEKNDPMYLLKNSCCWWSGQSWPYATSQTIKAMANLLQDYQQGVVSRSDYVQLLSTFAKTHRKNGKPYLAEACHPETGSFEGHDGYNHSEHYFHSSFNDLVITGLVGLVPQDNETIVIKSLAPPSWDYFALTEVPYRGRLISISWDRDGTRYKTGKGLRVFADGKEIAASPTLEPLVTKLTPLPTKVPASKSLVVNYAVNNDGTYYPRLKTTYSNPKSAPAKMVDGNYWYHRDPPNRWTCEGSPNLTDSIELDFGMNRSIDTVKFYLLDDGSGIVAPERIDLDAWDGSVWKPVVVESQRPAVPTGHCANVMVFPAMEIRKLRAVLHHARHGKSGLTELEAWGPGIRPIQVAPPPSGNLAYNPGNLPFPRASASYADRFGGKPSSAIDGITNFLPSPTNRWTSYESPNATDWLEIDFGASKAFTRVELAIYDDRGGVQPPARYELEFWNGTAWMPIKHKAMLPAQPTGSQINEIRFDRVAASKVRVVFTHAGRARSGVSELMIWND